MIDYFRKKQARLINSTPTDFIRATYLKPIMSANRLVGLIGHRGVGKTTLLLQYLKQNFPMSECLYVSVDDIHITNTTLYDLTDEFFILGGKVIVFDEIHKYRDWARELKNIYDSFPDMQIRFSGSSMLNIIHQTYDLSRRCLTVDMEILTFQEFMNLSKGKILDTFSLDDLLKKGAQIALDISLSDPDLYKDFLNYLVYGAYPFFMEDRETFSSKLFNALEKIINEDIPSCNKMDYAQISIFKRLIATLIQAKVPYKINVAGLSREFGVTAPTMNTYLDILNHTKIFHSIKKYSSKISRKPAKLLFHDTNILYAFADAFGVEANIGTVRETFFAGCFSHIFYSDIGDFRVGDILFEIGGKNKTFQQIHNVENSFLVVDTNYTTDKRKLPLWLFGLLIDPPGKL